MPFDDLSSRGGQVVVGLLLRLSWTEGTSPLPCRSRMGLEVSRPGITVLIQPQFCRVRFAQASNWPPEAPPAAKSCPA